MIHLKNSAQITAMKDAGRITGEALLVARDMVRPGVSTYEIDQTLMFLIIMYIQAHPKQQYRIQCLHHFVTVWYSIILILP